MPPPGIGLQMLAGVVPAAEEGVTRSAGVGFVRRRAGRIFLDIPAWLGPPARYRFVSEDDDANSEEIRLDLMLHSHPVAWSKPAGEVSEMHLESLAIVDRHIAVRRFVTDRRLRGEDLRSINMQGEIAFDDAVIVRAVGSAPINKAGHLDSAFKELLRNVRREE
jgi:hypothetical protein